MKTTKLINVSVLLTSDGLKITKRVREYKETGQMFIGVSLTERAFRIKKSKLMVPESRFTNQLGSLITFNTVCHPEDDTKAVNILIAEIGTRVKYFETELAKLKTGMKKPVIYKTYKTDDE